MSDGDARWVARCAAGDREALRELFDRYAAMVWRYGFARTGCRDAAGDIVQETFLRVVRSYHTFRGRSSAGTWLYAIARSVAIDHARREQRQRRLTEAPQIFRLIRPMVDEASAGGEAVTGPSPDDAGLDDAERDDVRQAVAELPPAMRDAIVLCEIGDMTIREAAEVLGWSETRVKVTLFRGRRKLREKLQVASCKLQKGIANGE
jgi:RNA polymerase sigma-70 factor (ECF subfamily)